MPTGPGPPGRDHQTGTARNWVASRGRGLDHPGVLTGRASVTGRPGPTIGGGGGGDLAPPGAEPGRWMQGNGQSHHTVKFTLPIDRI
jgi:hypothetical protein